MMSYRSDYPNQVHQFNVAISQNHYLLKDETIKWQEKKLDVNWKNYQKSGKRHLVNYIIRDHYSSCFYAALHPIDNLPKIEDFLYNAWRKKDSYEFYGVGNTIIVPQSTIDKFPTLNTFFKKSENLIHLQLPENGFASAIRSLREWEHQIRFMPSIFKEAVSWKGFHSSVDKINRFINNQYGSVDSNLTKWATGVPRIIDTNSEEVFKSYFYSN